MRPTEAGIPGLADRLNELFRTVRRPGTSDFWNNETAAWEISRSGPPVSAAYLSQLRTGKRLNPSARHLAALAGIFQVDMESFFPRSETIRLPLGSGGPGPELRHLVTLLDGLSPAGIVAVEGAIVRVRAAEGLPQVASHLSSGTSPFRTAPPETAADPAVDRRQPESRITGE